MGMDDKTRIAKMKEMLIGTEHGRYMCQEFAEGQAILTYDSDGKIHQVGICKAGEMVDGHK